MTPPSALSVLACRDSAKIDKISPPLPSPLLFLFGVPPSAGVLTVPGRAVVSAGWPVAGIDGVANGSVVLVAAAAATVAAVEPTVASLASCNSPMLPTFSFISLALAVGLNVDGDGDDDDDKSACFCLLASGFSAT